MKKITFLLIAVIIGYGSSVSAQVIISQYYEGASYNKWIEITNIGSSAVDLTSPQLYTCLFSNSSADDPGSFSPTSSQTLAGIVDPGDVLLFKNSGAVLPTYAIGTSSSIANFNGDDLIIISTSNGPSAWADRVDVIGNGTSWGGNTSFYRNSDIVSANTVYTPSEWAQVSNAEVDVASSSDSEYLGTHLYTPPPPPVPLGTTGIIIAIFLISAVLIVRRGRLI